MFLGTTNRLTPVFHCKNLNLLHRNPIFHLSNTKFPLPDKIVIQLCPLTTFTTHFPRVYFDSVQRYLMASDYIFFSARSPRLPTNILSALISVQIRSTRVSVTRINQPFARL
jgi:hypothetical protein